MIKTRGVKPLDKGIMEDLGMGWHTDRDGTDYIASELIQIDEDQAETYYDAANELYEMHLEAAQHVIDQKLYYELGIPSNLVNLIEHSWQQGDLHLYGRFDLAGGLNGLPIKLIEFNADTPTSLFETSIIQWAILKANDMDETLQFNNLHEMLQENFQRLITGDNEEALFSEHYAGQKLLFSSIRDLPEDERTVSYLESIAHDAGFYTGFCYMDEAGFDEQEGVFNQDNEPADFWFKLYPWEDIAADELELTRMLEKIALNDQGIFLNPAYTLLFQSKGMLKVLYDLFPDSPYLLETDFQPLNNTQQVEKKLFGREGANMRILSADGAVLEQTDGRYDHYKNIYQAYAEYPRDEQGHYYQAGVFHVQEACGLGFRRGGRILNDLSKFVGHFIE